MILVDRDIDGHVLDDLDAIVAQHFLVGEVFDVLQLLVVERGEVREVEAQVAGIDQRARLLHMRAQHIAQRGVQQMRAGMVAHGGAANFVVDHGVDFVADVNGLLGDDAMRAHALHRIGRAFDLGDEGVVIFAVEPAHIADLSAGVGVERRVIEHDLAALAGLQLVNAGADFPDPMRPPIAWNVSDPLVTTVGLPLLMMARTSAAGGERLVIALEDSVDGRD